MEHPSPSSKNGGDGVGTTFLDEHFIDTAKAQEYRLKISKTAWTTLSTREQTSLQEVTHMLTGDDQDLGAAYTQAVLIVNYVNQRANINADPTLLLPDEAYRFWY